MKQPAWGDEAEYFRERDMKYGMAKLRVLAIDNPKSDPSAATPSPTTFEELMQTLEIIHGIS